MDYRASPTWDVTNRVVATARPRRIRASVPVLAFTLLDAGTLEPVTSTPIFATNPAVTIDPAGTVWVIADGLQRIPEESIHWPTSLDVATLLDETRRQ